MSISRGVITGGTTAGTLFVLGIDPIFRMLICFIEREEAGIVRFPADDIECVLYRMSTLIPLASCFNSSGQASGHLLGTDKCLSFPLVTCCGIVGVRVLQM